MNKRISIRDLEPEGYKAVMALENYIKSIDLDPKLKELIKIRASQINGCEYCIDMHTDYALRLGEDPHRIDALTAWRDSPYFDEVERITFQLTEEMSLIHLYGVTDETYGKVTKYYGEKITAQLMLLIILINSWNRIAVSTKMIYPKK